MSILYVIKKWLKELIQNDFNTVNLVNELNRILNKKNKTQILSDYERMISLLGDEGASKRAAQAINSI